MGELVAFSGIVGEPGEPSARSALLRVASTKAATKGALQTLRDSKVRLADELSKASAAAAELDDHLDRDAATLIEWLRSGASFALSRLGGARSQALCARIEATRIEAEVGRRAEAGIDAEIAALEGKLEQLADAEKGLIRETVRETLQPALIADYGTLLAALQEAVARLRGIERYLSPPTSDYVPGASRVAIAVPNFAAGDGSDMAVTIEGREVQKIEAFMCSFAAALAHDPRSPAPELPELDPSPDLSVSYDRLTAPERARADREASFVTRQRATVDSELLAGQIRGALGAQG
jgi:hypothetical protein